MKIKNVTKWLTAAAVFSLLSLATERANAVLLEMQYATPSSPYLIGTAIPGLQGNGGQAARDAKMTNTLIGMTTLGSQTGSGTSGDPLYSRSFNSFSSLPAATTPGAVPVTNLSGGTGNVFIHLTGPQGVGMFQYLVAAYDGPNGGAAVWNIVNLTGTITIYGFAKPEKVNGHLTGNLLGSDHAQRGYFRITSYTLLNPTSVPDGGATVMLFGAVLATLGMVRRYLMQ